MRNIYFIWWKTYHCRRILNQVHLRWWHFVVKSVRFQQWLKWYTDPSQMRIQSYVCPVWPYNHQNFTKTLQIWQNNFTFSTMVDLTLISGAHAQSSKWQVKWRKVQNDVFPILIYEFNIIYFSKRRGGGYWREVLVRSNMVSASEPDVK